MAASRSAAIEPMPDVAPVMTTVFPRMAASRPVTLARPYAENPRPPQPPRALAGALPHLSGV